MEKADLISESVSTQFTLFASTYSAKDNSDWRVHIVKTAFLDNLPLKYLRFYPFNTVLVLGGLSYFVMIGLFTFFFASGYVQTMKEQFISLEKDAGRCSEVLKPLTGNYAVSDKAIWQGTKGFYFTNALYEIDFSSYSGSYNDFKKDLMAFYANKIAPEGNKAKQQTLYSNLITQMSFADTFQSELDNVEHTHTFSFTATPSMVFRKDYASGSICDRDSCCDQYPLISFDVSTSTQTVLYDYSQFSDFCTAVDDAEHLGYVDSYDHGKFQLDIDMNSVTTALALNMGILEYPGILETVTGIFEVSATGYTAVGVIDPRYEGMTPVNCLIPDASTEGSPICWILLANGGDNYPDDPVYALPLMGHFNEDLCQCGGANTTDYCNEIDLMAGLLYYKTDNWNDTQYSYLYSLSLAYATGAGFRALNIDAFDAMRYATGYSSDNLTLEESFAFCESEDGISCNIIAINTYDAKAPYVTMDYYYIEEGNCNDIMTIDNFEALAEKPPTSLTEQYYKCYSYTSNAFFGAAGIAFGNMSAFGPIVLLILIPLVASLLFWGLGEKVPDKKYTDGEKDAAAKELAMHLLLIKDMDHEELDPNCTLYRLGQDLKLLSEKYDEKSRNVSLRRLTKVPSTEANSLTL